ncbi:MAG: DeoR/GlpR transcriptional regulator [Clostridiales bacterium]|nr:MAG: DeoR/GlpR transcriptional regulator [Clostridiales bacterium]
MLAEERFRRILDILNRQHTAGIAELAAQIGTSESTIRRDIATLDQAGRLRRIYGGAMALQPQVLTIEEDVETKREKNVPEKDLIARYAAQAIHNDDFVFIDAGTTTFRMLEYINAPGAAYMTNGIAHAKALLKKGYKTIITGGEIRLKTDAIVGTDCIACLQRYNFTKCFMGANGIDIQCGYTTPDPEEAHVKTEVIRRSYVAYVLADHTKFHRVSSVTFAGLKTACILTDRLEDPTFHQHTVIKEIKEL